MIIYPNCSNNVYEFDEFFSDFQKAMVNGDLEKADLIIDEYLNSEDFIAHKIGYGLSAHIIKHTALLDMTEKIIKKCIEKNTIENLEKLGPENATVQKQNLDFCFYYSQHAWILWKKEQYKEAKEKIEKALEYQSLTNFQPEPQELLRLGIIRYYTGDEKEGWDIILQALVMDTQIENQDPEYKTVLEKIILQKTDGKEDATVFIKNYRARNRMSAPELMLTTFDDHPVELGKHKGKVIFVNFFSPNCGSCRMELPKVRQMYDRFSSRDDILFLFVLNKPQMKQQAVKLMEGFGYKDVTLCTLKNGIVWQYIPGEPTIWILDKEGKIAGQHLGYRDGDESIYEEEILGLL